MTREEALRSLCDRAANKNLYFASHAGADDGRPYGPTVGTVEGPELPEYRRLWGGKIATGRGGKETWVVADEEALTLIRELLPRTDFRRSGKWNYAKDVLNAHEDHSD